MPDSGPLTEQIASSIEDVKQLLDDNRSLSVAYLSRKLRDLEESTAARLKRLEAMLTETRDRQDKIADYVKANVKKAEK